MACKEKKGTPVFRLAAAVLMAGFADASIAASSQAEKPTWKGPFSYSFLFSGMKETITGTLRFEYRSTTGEKGDYEDTYVLVGDSLTWSVSGQSGNCSISGGPTRMAITEQNSWGNLLVQSDGRYQISAYMDQDKAPPGIITVTCTDEDGKVHTSSYQNRNNTLLSTGQQRLEGNEKDGRIARGSSTPVAVPGNIITYEWNLSIKPMQLAVDIDDFDNWLPEAGADEKTPGNELGIHARLLNPDSTLSERPADWYRFELTSVSQEPGICLNYPLPEKALSENDFQFLRSRNPSAEEMGETGQWIRMPMGKESTAHLSCFDWGSFGVLKVTAHIDGDSISGFLKGDKNQINIRLPKRKSSSKIADAWKEKKDARTLDDYDDSDAEPEGDGDKGDGFTLYEEYRGFMENGKHLETNPEKKDLFILDSLGGVSKRGIAMFANATKLQIHHELRRDEFADSQVMNVNRDKGPSLGYNQGGLLIRRTARKDASFVPVLGTPGRSRTVNIADFGIKAPIRLGTIVTRGVTPMSDYGAQVVGHELGHAVNVEHHGDGEHRSEWSTRSDGNGGVLRGDDGYPVIFEDGGSPIQVWIETGNAGVRIVPLWAQRPGAKMSGLWIGIQQGQSSGDQACMMRYSASNAYSQTAPHIRYLVRPTPENFGSLFCTSDKGTGVNLSSRQPWPRYGDAQRGNCLHRICVKDAVFFHPEPYSE
jgi:hypothetical protein